VPEGGEPVGEGNDWTTPWITENTTYWCADAAPAELDTIHGGMPGPSPEPGEEGDPSYYPIFECWSPFVLKSVLVHALFPGNRMVGLVEWPGGTTILSGNFYLPAGNSRIELNWPVTPGSYGLRMFGSNIGMTYEDVSGTYPYPLGNVGAIVSTTNGGSGATAYYEIFYDWEVVATQYGCESLRTPVNVTIGPVGVPDGGGQARNPPVSRTGPRQLANGPPHLARAGGLPGHGPGGPHGGAGPDHWRRCSRPGTCRTWHRAGTKCVSPARRAWW
jgi:hypothetical protein